MNTFVNPRYHSLVRELCCVMLFFASLHIILLPFMCREKCLYSAYFGISDKRLQEIVEKQQHQMSAKAEKYFSKLDKATSLEYHARKLHKSELDVLIVIVTVSRGEHNYLKRVVASLDAQMKSYKVENMAMMVCNAEIPGNSHTTALEVSEYFPTKPLYDENSKVYEKKRRVKEKIDYVGCINLALKTLNGTRCEARHVLVLEDDMAAVKQALIRLNAILGYKLLWKRDWALAKLSYPDKYKGYEKSWASVFEVTCVSVIIGTLMTLLTLRTFPRKQRKRREALILWAAFTLNMVVVVLGIGRQHLWLEMRKVIIPYHLSDAPGGCSGAVLYPMDKLPNILSFLSSIQEADKYPLDIALSDYLNLPETKLKGFLVEGNFFRHVGYFSSLHSGTKNALDFFIP